VGNAGLIFDASRREGSSRQLEGDQTSYVSGGVAEMQAKFYTHNPKMLHSPAMWLRYEENPRDELVIFL
jgi:hypothetical protein